MKKKILVSLLGLTFLILSTSLVKAQENKVSVSLFYSTTCPHCAKEKVFLNEYGKDNPDVEIRYFNIGEKDNAKLFQQVGDALKADISGVPFTVVCNEHFVGFHAADTTGVVFEEIVSQAKLTGCSDVVGSLVKGETLVETVEPVQKEPSDNYLIPVAGDVNLKDWSLPILTIVIALLDGFNPCALWVLVFLISMLLGMKDRKKMWLLGSVFIFTSALVYGLFLTAWLNIFLFIGYMRLIQILIGVVSIGISIYYLRDYWVNRSGGCKVVSSNQRQNIFERIKKITHTKSIGWALVGIVGLAVIVNMIELLCSAGLPAVYTSILSQSQLSAWSYYGYILLYILMFMLDDLIIFVVAMLTLEVVGIENKYARAAHVIGGVVMLVIGLAMLFKPELLMFG